MTEVSPTNMRAIGWLEAASKSGSGEGPRAFDLAVPDAGPGQVLVRVAFSALNPADVKVAKGEFVGRFLHARTKPLILGYDFAGTVVALGPGATEVEVGAPVYGHLPYAAGTRQGAFAEYVAVDRAGLAVLPDHVALEVGASAATPGLTALQSLRDLGRLPRDGRVLIIGAAGGVGSLAVGVAKRLGAKVTAVCSTYGKDFVEALGADVVIDRTQRDPLTLEGPFDVVFDAAAAHDYLACKHLLSAKGAYVRTQPDFGTGVGKAASLFSSRRCEAVLVKSTRADLELLGSWLATGMAAPIDARFAVKDLAGALRHLQSGRLRGRIVVQVEGGF